MELIDVLTPDGRPTGERKSKAAIHRDGDWHRAAHIWIVAPDGRILLQRRSLRKENNPGLWDVSAAGHLSAGESAIDAAIRETFEELGLTIAPDELKFIVTLRESCLLNNNTYYDNEFHEIFVVRRDVDIASLELDAEEVAEAKWVSELRPDDSYVPHEKEYSLLSRLPR
ncbi:MAG TPA: NUDIX domain-containing protein [Thermoanaerobaculia bacterium]|nr:NUDIX domain-containing protein [Thermoanaerobaculia bacterium]